MLNQTKYALRDLATKLQVALAQKAEMRTLIEVQEASKVNSERQVSESWRTIQRLTEVIQGLRNHLDDHRLSQDERAINVAGVLLEKGILQSQVQDLKHSLADMQTTTDAVTRRLASQLASCQELVRSKDEEISELESFQMKQDVHPSSGSARRKEAEQ